MSEPKKENRTLNIPPVRVNKSERDTIKANAKKFGYSVSEYLRVVGVAGGVVVKDNNRDDTRLIAALGQIGNNLNQLARSANIHGGLDPLTSEQLRQTLAAIQTTLNGALNGSEH